MGLFNRGFFKRKPSNYEKEQIELMLQQARESAEIVNTTYNPDIFFSRLSFTLDLLLDLKEYEKYPVFDVSTPTENYHKIVNSIEDIVNDFISRSFAHASESAKTLKTEKGRANRLRKYSQSMIDAFEKPSTSYWAQNRKNHYAEKLYTDNNLKKLHELLDPYLT